METKLLESLLDFKEVLAGLRILQSAINNESDTTDTKDIGKVLDIYINKLHQTINNLSDITDEVIIKYGKKHNLVPEH